MSRLIKVGGLVAAACWNRGNKSLDHSFHGLVKRPHRELARDGGNLHGDVIHVRTGNKGRNPRQTAIGFLIAQNCLAQEVNVQAVAVSP